MLALQSQIKSVTVPVGASLPFFHSRGRHQLAHIYMYHWCRMFLVGSDCTHKQYIHDAYYSDQKHRFSY